MNLSAIKGIVYTNDSVPHRNRVVGYHCSPNPRYMAGGLEDDIKSLPRRDRGLIMDADVCRYTIGFEIEKSEFAPRAVKRYPLFCGFERDSSCGVEAITNILPLLPPSEWRSKVFSLFYDANKIIDSEYSPTNRDCGGHITIGIKDMYGSDILKRVRPFMGIIYALWRGRLKNSYCRQNITMRTYDEAREGSRYYGSINSRYQPVLVKGDCIEFRLINRVDSVEQMIRRYELLYTLIHESGKRGMTFKKMFDKMLPILNRMYRSDYETDELLASHIELLYRFAKSFQYIIDNNEVSRDSLAGDFIYYYD